MDNTELIRDLREMLNRMGDILSQDDYQTICMAIRRLGGEP